MRSDPLRRRLARATFFASAIACCALLLASIWPGVLDQFFFGLPALLLSLPLFFLWIAWVAAVAVFEITGQSKGAPRRRWGQNAALLVTASLISVGFHLPKRIAFGAVDRQFASLLTEAPSAGSSYVALDREIGLYRVNAVGRDPRGGVFFRTHRGPAGLFDEMSYGFAWRPNEQGSPFGSAAYNWRPLFGDWYVFAASNDW